MTKPIDAIVDNMSVEERFDLLRNISQILIQVIKETPGGNERLHKRMVANPEIYGMLFLCAGE